MPEDFYAANGEWYAALVASWQEPTTAAVRALLGSLDGGNVIDIGSGIGSCLPLLRSLGAERLFGVEPSPSMRVGLMTTIASDPELMRRTTVVAAAFPEAVDRLPEHWTAAVMLNAIGHLDDETRTRLWSTLHDRLVPRGRFVVSTQPTETVMTIPWTDFGTVHVGEHQLRTRGRAGPLDDARVVSTMEWSLLNWAGDTLETRTARHAWQALGRAQLTDEAARWGLRPVDAATDGAIFAFEQQ